MMFMKIILITFYLIFSIIIIPVLSIISYFDNKESTLNYEVTNDYCMCIPFWQCKEDNSGFNEDGTDLVDIRKILRRRTAMDYQSCTGDFDVCCKIQCGRRGGTTASDNSYYTSRILGENNDSEFSEFPWMLAILQGKTYRCGGSLIHPKVALTVAHCLDPNAIATYQVRAGEWNWDNTKEPIEHQDRFVKKILIHPYYHAASLRNDIALIILEEPFQLTENVGVTCLPSKLLPSTNTKCTASGWGKSSYKSGAYQSVLKKIDLPIIPRRQCQAALREARLGPLFTLHPSFLCAGGELNRDTCKGDGGSPLVCVIDGEDERYEQVGIVSWGLTCGMHNTPGVYVNVALFRDWIDRQMQYLNFDTNVYRSH